ncbi:MAG: DUF4340 domain-containing protein [Halofilum sp. (in: g-proteobacteria)]|nr:DUF4340 domain-containing protein [Halofilum sp. (in: g-proteobacteria)]
MSGRGLLVLGVLAALAVVGAVLTRQPIDDVPETDTRPYFLPGLQERLEDVSRVEVRSPSGEALARVERRDRGWVVANRWDHPADLESLRGTLIGLAEARELEPKTDRVDGHARLGVAAPGSGSGSGLEVTLHGPGEPQSVVIGEPSTGEVGGTYLRRAGEDRAWLVSGELPRHDRISDWLNDLLVDVPAIRVHRVRIEPVDGEPVNVLLPSQDAPRFEILDIPEGRRALSRTLSKSIARGIADLRLVDVRPAADTRLPPRLATTRFELFSGLTIEIEVFAPGRGQLGDGLARLHAFAPTDAVSDVRERADALNARFDGWLYRLPEYKFVNLSYRFDQVLAPE